MVESVLECWRLCERCVDAILDEPEPAAGTDALRRCLDCAAVCEATAAILARPRGADVVLVQALLQVCVAATRLCHGACDAHASELGACAACAAACTTCEQACREALEVIVRAPVDAPANEHTLETE